MLLAAVHPDGPAGSPARRSPEPQNPQHVFSRLIEFVVVCASTQFGEAVSICGSCEALGLWVPEQSLRLRTDAATWPTWRGAVAIPSSCARFEFKLGIMAPSGAFKWEPLERNRVADANILRGNALSVEFSITYGRDQIVIHLGESVSPSPHAMPAHTSSDVSQSLRARLLAETHDILCPNSASPPAQSRHSPSSSPDPLYDIQPLPAPLLAPGIMESLSQLYLRAAKSGCISVAPRRLSAVVERAFSSPKSHGNACMPSLLNLRHARGRQPHHHAPSQHQQLPAGAISARPASTPSMLPHAQSMPGAIPPAMPPRRQRIIRRSHSYSGHRAVVGLEPILEAASECGDSSEDEDTLTSSPDDDDDRASGCSSTRSVPDRSTLQPRFGSRQPLSAAFQCSYYPLTERFGKPLTYDVSPRAGHSLGDDGQERSKTVQALGLFERSSRSRNDHASFL
eukprot:tig00021319_g20201.t1